MLPSQYISLNMISGTNCYFNTGVTTSNTLNVTGLFYLSPNTTATYVFGARESNSTSSAGQLNFFQNATGTSYFGFASARSSISEYTVRRETYIENIKNNISILSEVSSIQKTGSTATFTGNRPIYLLAMNNAGNVSYGSDALMPRMRAFKMDDDARDIHHNYAPCYDTDTQQFGLYDLEEETFLTNQGTGVITSAYLLEVYSTVGGDAYIRTDNAGNVDKQYKAEGSADNHNPCVARPIKGYAFLNWTDSNGNILSSEKEYYPSAINEDTFITANFVKKTSEEVGEQYQLLGLEYGYDYNAISQNTKYYLSHLYSFVSDFSCKEDALARATSTIELVSVPSAYQINMPVVLFSPKGEPLWYGIITAIDGNKLTCREPISIYDADLICVPSNSVDGLNLTNYTITYATWLYYLENFSNIKNISSAASNYFVDRMLKTISDGSKEYFSFNRNKNNFANFPLIGETSVMNVEEALFKLFDQFGIIAEPGINKVHFDMYPSAGTKYLLSIRIVNPKWYDVVTISDNSEAISNVDVVEEAQNDTILTIYNSTGSTLRGVYAMTSDGTLDVIVDPSSPSAPSNYVAYKECKNKLVMSDDKIVTLAEQYIGNSLLNHKITMNVNLDDTMYDFEDFRIGAPVDFYRGDKLYKSVITAKEFNKAQGRSDIISVKLTLGNVRTNLTTKLNIGKTKKK